MSAKRSPSLARRLLLPAAIAGALALAAVGVWLAQPGEPASPASEIAKRMAGERWYAVAFRHVPIGHYRTLSATTAEGDFEFRTTLHFKLAGDGETRMEDTLLFQRRPPHRLQRAEHVAIAGDARKRIVIADGVATIWDDDEARQRELALDLEMGDYLAVEIWLAGATAQVGDTQTARSLSFDRLAVLRDRWQLLARDENGYQVANDSRSSTRIVLDADHAPYRVQMGDLFTLQRAADENAARAWQRDEPLFGAYAEARRVAADRAIANPHQLRRLVLAVEQVVGVGVWPERLVVDVATSRRASVAEIASASAATASYPADDQRLVDLAAQAVGGIDGADAQTDALTLFVHRYLRYRDSGGVRSVYDTLRDRQGDCTEYADLTTTLARAVGLPARTVIGLAYRDDEFALHAWNEVVVDNVWRGVDPTWGLTRLAATHLPLPSANAVAAIVDLPFLRFRIVETGY